MTAWTRRLKTLIDIGFAAYNAKMSPMNAALSYNLKNAVTLGAPYQVNYAKVLYSKGHLQLPSVPKVATTLAARLDYTWPVNAGETNALGTDKITFMVYNEAKDLFVKLNGGAVRSALNYNLLLPGDFSGDDVHCYISFASANGKMVSDSYYVCDVCELLFLEGRPSTADTAWSPALFPADRLVKVTSPGIVYGIYYAALGRIGHCGIVTQVKDDWVTGCKRNTNVAGSREGQGVYERIRHKCTISIFANWLK